MPVREDRPYVQFNFLVDLDRPGMDPQSYSGGFQEVSGDLVVIQDADLEYSPEEFPDLIELICEGRADVVYGSRFLGRHRVFLFTHYAGNRLLTLISNVVTGLNLSDMATCYKAFHRRVVPALDLQSPGFGIDAEITAKIARAGFRVFEVPVSYFGRSRAEGKKIRLKDGFSALGALARYARGGRATSAREGGTR